LTYRTVFRTVVDPVETLVQSHKGDQGEDERDDSEECSKPLYEDVKRTSNLVSVLFMSRRDNYHDTRPRKTILTVKMNPGNPPLFLKMANNSPKKAKLANPAEMAVMIKDPVRPLGLPGIRG
jgi:hypothetical protein